MYDVKLVEIVSIIVMCFAVRSKVESQPIDNEEDGSLEGRGDTSLACTLRAVCKNSACREKCMCDAGESYRIDGNDGGGGGEQATCLHAEGAKKAAKSSSL